ncbi:MAG: histidine kinase [Acidipropionibacterium sp.]|nr:histidine kinase [Acidipropionibacterium sp.]
MSHGMLCSRFDAQQELERTRASRTAGRVAESEGLRRLERDLHDGPQQRLIRTLMDLGRAERAISEDPQRAGALIGEIRGQTNDTLAELRRLSRGIAPPLLVDRGLAAALAEIAGNSVIPTTVRCPSDRLPLHVETGVYYVASEALANANKYSGASRISIDVAIGRQDAAVRIADDGVGGAQSLAGHGLEGLAERVASLEGALQIDSPAGAGTRVEAVIPCAS